MQNTKVFKSLREKKDTFLNSNQDLLFISCKKKKKLFC